MKEDKEDVLLPAIEAQSSVKVRRKDFILRVPNEITLEVFSFLNPNDLLSVAQACSKWRDLGEDDSLWRKICSRTDTTLEALTSWKAAFMRRHQIEWNWSLKPIRPFTVINGLNDLKTFQLSGTRIVTGSLDGAVRLWSVLTGECLHTLTGHTDTIRSTQLSSRRIISGSEDSTIKVWSGETGRCIRTLHGHTSAVSCMHVSGTQMVSGSWDATLRLWDIETGACTRVFVGHNAEISCVRYNRLVVSGARDCLVKVWNVDNGQCLHTLVGHNQRVHSLQFDGVHSVSGSSDKICVWDIERGLCLHVFTGYPHTSFEDPMIKLRANILVSADRDSNSVKVRDIFTGQCLQSFSPLDKHLFFTGILINNRFIVTSSFDGRVKLWNIKTGKFIRDLVVLNNSLERAMGMLANETKLVCFTSSVSGHVTGKLLILDFDNEGSEPF